MPDVKTKIIHIPGFILPLLMVVLTPFLIAVQVYFPNSAEFSVPIQNLVKFLLPILCAVFLFLLIVLALIPRSLQTYVLCFFASLGILFWIQGSLVNWNYGVLVGVPIVWSNYGIRLVIDIGIWIIVTVLFLIYAKRIRPYLGCVSALVLFMQAISLYFAYSASSGPPGFQRYTISENEKMYFSREKNVVILMLDAFQSDIFQELIDKHPKYREVFKGFTFFRNTTAQYSKTYGAVPALLTGKWYENKLPVQVFLKESFGDSISTRLLKDGWSTQLYPSVPRIIGYDESYASNLHLTADHSTIASEAGKLLDVGFFRSSPQFLKPFWLNDFQWRLTNAMAGITQNNIETDNAESARSDFFHPIQQFVYESQTLLNDKSPDPTFKFFHFNIPHEPFVLNEQLRFERLPSTREGFVRYSAAGLEATGLFIEQLRANDLYDQTMIFVVGDHGGGEYNPGILHHEDIDSSTGDIPSPHHESGMPLLLVKPFNSFGELKISDAPASLGDTLKTISTALELDYDYEGYDLFSLSENYSRVRRYIFYEFSGWMPDYLPDMIEYEVMGHAWSPSSWYLSGRIFSPESMDEKVEVADDSSDTLSDEQVYSFAFHEGSDIILEGWLLPEEHGVWSGDYNAFLEFEVHQDIVFPIKVSVFLLPYKCNYRLEFQRVFVSADQSNFIQLDVDREGWYHFIVKEADQQNRIQVIFHFPDAVSPVECQNDLNNYPLAVSMRFLKFEPFDCSYILSQIIDFSADGESSRYIVDGWSAQEPQHRWTDGKQARLMMNILKFDDKDLLLRLNSHEANVRKGMSHQKVEVIINDFHITTWKMGKQKWYEALIPKKLLEDGQLNILFQIHDPVAPCEVKDSLDCRKLGFLVSEVQIVYSSENVFGKTRETR